MRTAILMTSLGAAVAALLVGPVQRAEACGGCFSPPITPGDPVTVVNSHRMVVALSLGRTILWDQIQYAGNPKDFVWVLPVPTPSVTIDVADSAFFDELDQLTSPIVQPRPLPPPAYDGPLIGCGDSGAVAGDDDDGTGDPDDVIIYDDRVVGPYQTVTIGSEDAGALQNWLVENNYHVPESTVPTIMHYVDRGSVFVVLRMAPGLGTDAMKPIRVGYPGYMATFPLEMVSVGAQGVLGMSLWVVSDQRYASLNYTTVQMSPASLVFDWTTSQSNYEQAFQQTIENAGGRAWVTEYADSLWTIPFASTAEPAIIEALIAYPYVTRLRTRMLVDYLTDDLILVPNGGGTLGRVIIAGTEIARPATGGDDGCAVGSRHRMHPVAFALLVVGIELTWRRRRRARARAPSG